MTITKISYLNIREALDKIFDKEENKADSFTISCPMDYDTRKVTWGVNLSSRGTQTTETMDETIKRLTLANNICKALNALDITVEVGDTDLIHTLSAVGKVEKAIAINETYIATIASALESFSTVEGVMKVFISEMDEFMRRDTL